MSALPLLVIDDDDAIARMVVDVLRDEGYSVESAASGEDALALLSVRGCDAYGVILSDSFVRPPSDPYAWYDRLRTHTHAPIMIVSAVPQQTYADHRVRGYAGFLAKPFDLDALLTLVASLCAQPAEPAGNDVGTVAD